MLFKKKWYKIIFLCFLIGIFGALMIFQPQDNETEVDSRVMDANTIDMTNENNPKPPKTSGAWVLPNITIDELGVIPGSFTWLEANDTDWCDGAGIRGDPYVIENVTIDGEGLRSCISIYDSDFYFEINNCTVYNSPAGDYAGIYLSGVQNGALTGNNCSFNDNYGIHIKSGVEINISNNNIIKNNTIAGIHFEDSDYINIISNTITNSSGSGIFLEGICQYYIISKNNISEITKWNSEAAGIKITGAPRYITIEDNKIFDIRGCGIKHDDGMLIDSDIINNRIYNNTKTGILINQSTTGAAFFDISYNEIKNNGHFGMYLYQFQSGDIIGNLIDQSGYGNSWQDSGLCVDKSCEMITIKDNIISNNKKYGVNISYQTTDITIYNNTFINQPYNAIDYEGVKWWDQGLGNYWDDYWGDDVDDNGIGDYFYFIFGPAGAVDEKPIWWDAPEILNIYPVQGSTHGTDAPEYKIKVDEGRGDHFWYEIIGTGENRSHTKLKEDIDETTEGTINQTLWDGLSQGTITIRFYVNDSRGYTGFVDVVVTKYIPKSPVIIIADDDDDDEDEEDPYLWIVRAAIGGALSACVGIVIKQSFSTVKKKRQLYELISKKLDTLDDIEGYLKDNLGKVDWEYFKPSYDQYINRKISQKELIKEGKNLMGKSFTELFEAKSKKKFAK